MRYTNCCKSTRKNKKCTRKDGKHFSLQRRFTKKKCIKGPVKGFTMRASCAPYKFCKQKGGARKTRKLLPKLRKISYKNKKHHYRLKDPFRKRKLAIHEGVNREAKKTGKTKKKAAIAKKGRFNILRIYRKNKKIKECKTITHDMRYMDRKYGLGKTKNICGQKGGMISEFISDNEETNNEPEPNTYFIIKNTETEIKNFATEISKRIVEGQYMHHGYDTFYYLEQLEATMLEALFSRENINGFYIVTYYPNNNSTYGGFSESFYNNLQVLHEHLQITEANNRFPNNTVELEVSVLGEQDDPNTVAGVTNFTGGRKHHRKKTRKKKGGTNPLQFRGKGELIELLLGQIGPDYEGAIFETKEYNFIQRNWGNNKIYIKKENLDELDEEANSIPNYTIDDNDNPTNNIVYLPIDPLITGWVRIRKKDGEWFISEESQIQLTGGYKKKRDNLQKSILNEELQVCSKDPMTGFTRDGYCRTNSNDSGSHLVCAKMDQQFLDYTKSQGNDLSSVVKDGENWCLCQDRWLQAHKVKKAPKIIKSATNSMIRDDVKTAIGQKGGGFSGGKRHKKRGGRKPLPRAREVVNLGWRVNRHGLDPTPAENEQLREQVEAENAFANATTEFGDEDDDEDDLMEYTAVPPLEYVDRHQFLISSMAGRYEERLEESEEEQESALYDRTIFMTRDELQQEDYEPYYNINEIVYIEDIDDETEHILSNDEINRFNIQDNETLLNTIHYNHFSLWRIIAIESVENFLPHYKLQSVDDTNIEIIRSQDMLYDDVEDYLREARERHQRWFGTGGRRKKKTRKRRKNKRKKTRKKQFLYNPDDPSKSFDVYIDKNPNDTIPIKYTTVKDVKDTIKKLERLYKTKKYPHKRIWQVGMIMKVRLEAMLKHITKKYPNAKKVKQRYILANKYFKFLGKRTKKKDFKSRKGMTFKF